MQISVSVESDLMTDLVSSQCFGVPSIPLGCCLSRANYSPLSSFKWQTAEIVDFFEIEVIPPLSRATSVY